MAHGLSMWDPPGPWIKPMPPALQGGFFTTEPPGKPSTNLMLPKETPWFLLLPISVNYTTQMLKPDPGMLSLMLSSPQHSVFNPSSSLTLVSPPLLLGSPGGSAVKNLPAVQETQETWCLISGSGRSPGEGNGNTSPIFLPGKSHRQKSLVVYSP